MDVTPYGLHVPSANVYLDARTAPGAVFVSHAHADHCTEAAHIICTPETAALHQARRGAREAITIPLGQSRHVGNAELTMHSAAHALGSAMLSARTADGVVAYTGDYKLRPNPFAPAPHIPRCDTLVMECTFGEPRYRFPPDDELLAQLFAFIDNAFSHGATPVVLAYALGKGQEALYHLTSHGYDVMLHGAIARMCQLHVELGFPFPGPGTWTRYRRGEVGRRVLLTTPSTRKTPMVTNLEPRRIVYLTGWAYHPGAHNMYKDCDLVLPLSDHADFDELVRTADESGARKIYTVHGAPKFAAYLRTLGMDAEHLIAHPQECDDQLEML
ncbi:MAG: MBL fold metallo-hydrolase [Gemmatimonadota bacterium]|nr:MBL fold metallo-hydrolase [Gemmatimonadota bacterium]